jgi:hypothetical protein
VEDIPLLVVMMLVPVKQDGSIHQAKCDPGNADYHTVPFDGSNLASGVNFYRVQAGVFVQMRKVLLTDNNCCNVCEKRWLGVVRAFFV